ncbi:MAG: hypothetical protein ABIW76_05745 [Fibrobacteria bacterium]
MDETFDSSALRTKVEEALRFFVKLPMRKPASADPSTNFSGNAFLEIPGSKAKVIAFSEGEGRVDVNFGPGRGSFDFSGSWIEDEDEDKEVSLSAEAAEAELEEDFKEELEAMVNLALDIIDESVFAARYVEDGIPMEGLFPAEEFEAMKGIPGFTSISWNGTYTRNYPAP